MGILINTARQDSHQAQLCSLCTAQSHKPEQGWKETGKKEKPSRCSADVCELALRRMPV